MLPTLGFAEKSFHCFGTEPFWDMQLNQTGFQFKHDKIKYKLKTVKPESARGFQISHIKIYKTRINSINSPATIIIQKQKCSDNMSDNEYQYSVIFITKHDNYYGCCTLK